MADSRKYLFAPLNSKLEMHLPLTADSDEEITIALLPEIQVNDESDEDTIDLSFKTESGTPDYFLLKIEILHRLLNECLASLQSSERNSRCKNRYLPLAYTISLMTAGALVFLTGILANVIPITRYNKIARVFNEEYKTTPIPGNHTCDLVTIWQVTRGGGSLINKTPMNNPRAACNALMESQYPNSLRLEAISWPALPIEVTTICLEAFVELCKDFNKTLYSKSGYLSLTIGAPIALTFIAIFLAVAGYYTIPQHKTIMFKDLTLSQKKKERIKAILDTFQIDSSNDDSQSIDELRTQIETIKEDLSNTERRYFTEKNILGNKIQGQHHFFKGLLDMVSPEPINITNNDVEKMWSTAKKAALFK